MQVPDLSAFSALRHLELSYNAVHSLAPLKACGATRLEELYAASNKISEVRALATERLFAGFCEAARSAHAIQQIMSCCTAW